MLKRILLFPFLFLLLLAAGLALTHFGFTRVEALRQMERIPRVLIVELIPGEANIAGRARVHNNQTLRAPDTQSTTLYYRYVVERRTTDSDGNTSWETERTETRMVPFAVEDDSGRVLVDPDSSARITPRRMNRRTVGDRRFTEYRIDPGHRVFVMGMASRVHGDLVIGFTEPGSYQPILSTLSEEEERGAVGLTSVLLTVGGLLGLSLAMYMLTRIFAIHQTLAYLILVTLTIVLALFALSMEMMERDIVEAQTRVQREQEVRADKVQALLGAANISWDRDWMTLTDTLATAPPRLGSDARERIQRHRINLARSMQRADRASAGFLARRVAARAGIPRIQFLPLSEEEQAYLQQTESEFIPSRLNQRTAWILMGIGTFGAILLAGLGFRRIRTKRWIEKIPTVKTRGVVYGMNEIKGKAIMPVDVQPLQGPISGRPCCYYRYIIRERRRSNRKTEWVTIHDEAKHVPFLCQDKEGTIPVHCDGADIIVKTQSKRRQGIRRHTEYCIPLDTELYVLGSAIVDPETHDRLVIASGQEKSLPFIISDHSDRELIAQKAAKGFLMLNYGFSFMLLASFGLGGALWGFEPAIYMMAALAPLTYLLLFMFVLIYNDLVYLRRRCEAMWANIDVALKKRFDLIPQLQAAAKGYLAHERDLQERITALRTEYQAAQPEQAGPLMAEEALLLRQVMGAMENYPELQGDSVMADVFRRIRDLEDEVALMREGYNHAVEVYDTRLERFPDILAKLLGFESRGFFEYREESH